MDRVNSVVIGAGVIGLAVARALALSGREVLVLESERSIGTGISSRNSEVIHGGLYYAPGSLKARLCVAGRRLLYDYCAARGVAHRKLGKLVVGTQPGHDVDYLYGQVPINESFIDWSGNCGNLSSAVGPFAIANGFIDAARIPENGVVTVRIWQANIHKTIVAHVQVTNGEVQETGDFELDGVTFPAAEVQLEFIDPADEGDGDGGGAMFPTGQLGRMSSTCRGMGVFKAR